MPRLVQSIVLLGWVVALVLATTNTGRSSYPRPNRGFKNAQLSTARGFGKRDGPLSAAVAAGQPTNFDGIIPINFDARTSYPNAWLIEELQSNPEVARLIVEKFVDENGDGELTPEELYRRAYY